MCSCFRTALTLYKLWHAVAREQALHHLRGGAHPRPQQQRGHRSVKHVTNLPDWVEAFNASQSKSVGQY